MPLRKAFMLTQQQLTHYHEQGYVIPDFRLPASTIQSIKDDFDRLLVGYPEFRQNCPALLTYDTTFLNYARNPDILDMVTQILGEDIAIWNSSYFGKPAHDGKKVPWHQDGRYWPIRPLASCSVWIAIDDSNTGNGCLRIIPGSHRSRQLFKHENNPSDDLVLSLELMRSEFDESTAVDIILESGQISLHDVFLMHGSEPNTSGKPRRGMTLRFFPTTSVYERDIEGGDQPRSLFLMRGVDRSGRNDFVVKPLPAPE